MYECDFFYRSKNTIVEYNGKKTKIIVLKNLKNEYIVKTMHQNNKDNIVFFIDQSMALYELSNTDYFLGINKFVELRKKKGIKYDYDFDYQKNIILPKNYFWNNKYLIVYQKEKKYILYRFPKNLFY